MFIDTYEAPYTGACFRDSTRRKGSLRTASVIKQLAGILELAGWVKTTDLFASGKITYKLGFPYVITTIPLPVLTPVTCGITYLNFQGKRFTFYNSFTEVPADTGCIWVPWGSTPLGSLGNLAQAFTLAFAPVYGAGALTNPDNPAWMDFKVDAMIPGPDYNFAFPFSGDGRWGAGAIMEGGGWRYTSQRVPSQSGGGQYDVAITGQANGKGSLLGQSPDDGLIQFDFKIEGEHVIYQFDCWTLEGTAEIVMLANPFGFVLFDPGNDSHFLCSTSLWVQSPDVTNFPGINNLTIIIAPGKFRNSTSAWNSCTVALNGSPTTFNNGAFPRPLSNRWPGPTTMLTPDDAPYMIGCYIMTGAVAADPAVGVVGRLWDCLISSDYVTDGLKIGDDPYQRISAQTGFDPLITGGTYLTRASILMQYKKADPNGSDGGNTPTGTLIQPVGGLPGLPWSFDITLPFGTAASVVTLTISGTLPAGVTVTLDATDHRIIHIVSTGTPAGSYSFGITASIPGAVYAVQVLAYVNSAIDIDRQTSLTPVAGVGDGAIYFYYENETVLGGAGPLYQWSINPATTHLPPSLSLATLTGFLANYGFSGGWSFNFRALPADVGTWSFDVTVEDSVYLSDPTQTAHKKTITASFTIPPGLSGPVLVGGTSGYLLPNQTLTAKVGELFVFDAGITGGTQPYVIHNSGAIPLGIDYDPNLGWLALRGTPLFAGVYSFALYVVDAAAVIGSGVFFQITVNA